MEQIGSTKRDVNPFYKNGYASTRDFYSNEWKELYSYFEGIQSTFLPPIKNDLEKKYKWVVDPLHTWSRPWEYTYVFSQLSYWKEKFSSSEKPLLLDIGSGVNFFPIALIENDFRVVQVDMDKLLLDIFTDHYKGTYDQNHLLALPANALNLPLKSNSVDAIYSISVLEHISEPQNAIEEIGRVLKPDGILTMTIDIGYGGNYQIDSENFLKLMESVEKHFEPLWDTRLIHPSDFLTTENSPLFRYKGPKLLSRLKISLLQGIKYTFNLKNIDKPTRLCLGFSGVKRKGD